MATYLLSLLSKWKSSWLKQMCPIWTVNRRWTLCQAGWWNVYNYKCLGCKEETATFLLTEKKKKPNPRTHVGTLKFRGPISAADSVAPAFSKAAVPGCDVSLLLRKNTLLPAVVCSSVCLLISACMFFPHKHSFISPTRSVSLITIPHPSLQSL